MFWGLTIEPGKHYTQTVEESFHVSMVALDTRDVAATEREQAKMTQLMVHHDKAEFLVCTLCFSNILQQPLDLNFTEGEEVTFFSEGRGTLHLTGYLVKDEPLTLDPDAITGDMLTGLEELKNYSDGWASGEESSAEGQVKGERSRQLPLRPRLNKRYAVAFAARQRQLAFASHRRHLKNLNAQAKLLGRRRRSLRQRTSSYLSQYALVSDEEDYYIPAGRLRTLRRVRPAPEQHVVLCTSDNVRATLTLSENSRGASKEEGRCQETVVPGRPQGGSVLAEALGPQRRRVHYTVPSSRENLPESDDVVIVGNSVVSEEGQGRPRSFQMRKFADKASLKENDTNADNSVDGRGAKSSPSFSRRKPAFVQRAERQAPQSPVSKRLLSPELNDSQAESASHQAGNAMGSPAKGSPRKRQLKSLPGFPRPQKRMLSSGFLLPHKKMFQRKASSRGRGRLGETSPSQDASVADQEGSEMTGSQFDDDSPGQGLIDDQGQRTSNCFPHPGGNQDQMLPPVTMSQSHHASPDNQPRSAAESLDQYLVDSKHGLVPTSLAMAVDPALSRSSPPVPGVSTGQTLAVRNTSGVYWSCLSDEQAEMGLGEADSFALNTNSNVPVAMDMDFLSAEDMSCNGANIGNQKIRLAHGYDIFVSRFDLWQAEKASYKKGWTILTRRLLDIFFDRMTLAMGKPTHHGNSMEYIPLDQNVVGAIIAFIKARYNINEKRKLIQAISIYCSDCRKSGVPGHLI